MSLYPKDLPASVSLSSICFPAASYCSSPSLLSRFLFFCRFFPIWLWKSRSVFWKTQNCAVPIYFGLIEHEYRTGELDHMPSLLSLSSAMVSFTPLPFGSEMNGLLPCNCVLLWNIGFKRTIKNKWQPCQWWRHSWAWWRRHDHCSPWCGRCQRTQDASPCLNFVEDSWFMILIKKQGLECCGIRN